MHYLKSCLLAVVSTLPTIFIAGSAIADDSQDRFDQRKSRVIEKLRERRENNETYADIIRVVNNRGVKGRLAPQVRITSPLNGGIVARGEGIQGAGDIDGSGFALNLEILTRDETAILLDEATQDPERAGIRHAELVGERNEDFPGLFVFIDKDLIKPDGGIIPKNANLANLFNVAGTDDTPGPGITAWVGWHVLESLPLGTEEFTITAAVVDEEGRVGFDKITVNVDDALKSANALTPDPSTFSFLNGGTISSDGPNVEIVAPRTPSSIAVGEQILLPDGETGSLNFIQVNVLDIAGAGIAVDEVGETVTAPEFGPGVILDPTRLPLGEPNRNFPGLHFSFDVPLQAPTGVRVEAGGNLAPVFNVVGSEIDPLTGAVRVVADWVVGGSLVLDNNQQFVTFRAEVTDNLGNTGVSERRFRISETLGGQLLTPAP